MVWDDVNRATCLGADLIKKLGLKLIEYRQKSLLNKTNSTCKDKNTNNRLQVKLENLFDRIGKLNNYVVRTQFRNSLQ